MKKQAAKEESRNVGRGKVPIGKVAMSKEAIGKKATGKVVAIIKTGHNKTGVEIQTSKDLTTEINNREIILTGINKGHRKTVVTNNGLITGINKVEELIQTGISRGHNRTGQTSGRHSSVLITDLITKTNRNKN